ncbi:rhodanese-like domain-containing protein, partial [Acinetobacter baumannii]|nr:rhodanese-like domain-containing protein [Acinetobacter baumannii]
ILLVCASGGRSSSAAEYLVGQGFSKEQVGNLEGGTYGWMSAGLAVER